MQALAEELHKPTEETFEKRNVRVNDIDEILASDLVDMQSLSKFNNSVECLLPVIDVFFKKKYGWFVPLKNKIGKSVAKTLNKIFKKRKPSKMSVDKGKEFCNKNVEELFELYSTENKEKSSVIER